MALSSVSVIRTHAPAKKYFQRRLDAPPEASRAIRSRRPGPRTLGPVSRDGAYLAIVAAHLRIRRRRCRLSPSNRSNRRTPRSHTASDTRVTCRSPRASTHRIRAGSDGGFEFTNAGSVFQIGTSTGWLMSKRGSTSQTLASSSDRRPAAYSFDCTCGHAGAVCAPADRRSPPPL